VRGQPCPPEVAAHVKDHGVIAAWNASFEFWAWRTILGPKHGWPVPKIEQMVDTMAQAAAMSIPQSLDGAAQALAMAEQKDKDGMRLIRKFSMPRKAKKGEAPGRLYWTNPEDAPEDFAAFVAYCAQDVEVERAIRKKLVPLSDYEQRVWELTLRMNDRGAHLDMALVDALQRIAEQAKARLDKEMAEATGHAVSACSQVAALTRWLQAQGVDAEKLNKNAIEDLLSGDLPEQARRAVELRKEAAKTSTAKLDSMQAVVCRDDRARGLHLYHGAGTGRWSGRLIQTQNMPRGTGTVKDPEDAVDDMLTGDARWIDLVYGRPMSAVSDMLRSCITASPGNRLLAADYSSIEGRVTSWLAGEQDEIDAYRANDAGTGAGIYEIAAGGIFNVDPFKVTKGQRQVGKAATLALGFGGGVLAFNSMAGIYGIDMAPVYPILRETASAEVLERAGARYEECFERSDTGTDLLTREAWIASEVTKVLWRNKHPHTVDLWRGLEDAARQAVQDPGLISTYGKISYRVARGFLWCRLPSGRCLAYGSPRIEDRKTPWGDTKPSVTALGVDSVTKRWTRFALYGGLLTENAVQAVARDLMAHGMLQAEDAGYPIVLTVHDEAVADVPEGFGSLAEFERLLCSLPEWASGLPVEASGWEGHRYRKD
jgi:DNA polymerase